MLLSSSLRPCSPFPTPFPWLRPSYLAGSLCNEGFLSINTMLGQLALNQIEHGTAARCKPPAGPHAVATTGPAACLCPAPSSSSPSSRHGATERARTSAVHPCAAAAAFCTRVDSPRVCLCACILRAASGARRGGQKVAKSRVALRRSFTIAVEKRACVKLSVRSCLAYLSMCGRRIRRAC